MQGEAAAFAADKRAAIDTALQQMRADATAAEANFRAGRGGIPILDGIDDGFDGVPRGLRQGQSGSHGTLSKRAGTGADACASSNLIKTEPSIRRGCDMAIGGIGNLCRDLLMAPHDALLAAIATSSDAKVLGSNNSAFDRLGFQGCRRALRRFGKVARAAVNDDAAVLKLVAVQDPAGQQDRRSRQRLQDGVCPRR